MLVTILIIPHFPLTSFSTWLDRFGRGYASTILANNHVSIVFERGGDALVGQEQILLIPSSSSNNLRPIGSQLERDIIIVLKKTRFSREGVEEEGRERVLDAVFYRVFHRISLRLEQKEKEKERRVASRNVIKCSRERNPNEIAV